MNEPAAAHREVLEALDRILSRGGDADDVLRAVVELLGERLPGSSWVGISFVEGGELVLGPSFGTPSRSPAGGSTLEVPVLYGGSEVARVSVEQSGPHGPGDLDRSFLERVAVLVSPLCLVGWDTGGESWE